MNIIIIQKENCYILQFQRSAVDHYCSLYGHHPSFSSSNLLYYKKHALYDNIHHVIFCFVPKVGCTSLKYLFFINQGLIPRTELNKPLDKLNKHLLVSLVKSRNLNRVKKLDMYYKFVMVRNPLERLVSGFRDKIEIHNLTNFGSPHKWVWARHLIFKKIHNQRWTKNTSISFSDFIVYWLNPDSSWFSTNDHFMPIVNVCQPCAARFDYYGNFNHFDRDAAVLIDKIGASSSDLRQGYYSEQSSTDQRMKLYYSTLTDELKIAVVRKLALDLEFYYTIFPEERDIHKHILNITSDLELPFVV